MQRFPLNRRQIRSQNDAKNRLTCRHSFGQCGRFKSLVALEDSAFKLVDRLSRRSFVGDYQYGVGVVCGGGKVIKICLVCRLLHLRPRYGDCALYLCSVATSARLWVLQALIQRATKAYKGKILLRLKVSDVKQNAIALYNTQWVPRIRITMLLMKTRLTPFVCKNAFVMGERQTTRPCLGWLSNAIYLWSGVVAKWCCLRCILVHQATTNDEARNLAWSDDDFHDLGHVLSSLMAWRWRKKSGYRDVCWAKRPLFVDSGCVTKLKKDVITRVHQSFVKQCDELMYRSLNSCDALEQLIEVRLSRAGLIILISTFRMDGKKSPRIVVMSGYERTLYFVHDPDLERWHLIGSMIRKPHWICQIRPYRAHEFEKMSPLWQSSSTGDGCFWNAK